VAVRAARATCPALASVERYMRANGRSKAVRTRRGSQARERRNVTVTSMEVKMRARRVRGSYRAPGTWTAPTRTSRISPRIVAKASRRGMARRPR
jgi:hypothetical protein